MANIDIASIKVIVPMVLCNIVLVPIVLFNIVMFPIVLAITG